MEKEYVIKLNKVRKVFGSKLSRMRPHDLISLSVTKKKFLTAKEQAKMQEAADKIRGGMFDGEMDLLVQRGTKQIKITQFAV